MKELTFILIYFSVFFYMKIFIHAIMSTPKAIIMIPTGIFRLGKNEESNLDRLEV